MEIKLKKNNIIFIEDSVFLADGFTLFLEKLVKKLSNQNLTIYVDNNIDNIIDNYKLVSQNKEAYLIDGLVDIIKKYKMLQKIETKGYFITDELEKVMKDSDDPYVLILTQKESIFHTFSKLKKKYKDTIIAKFNQDIIEWKTTFKSQSDAFYLHKDTYINILDSKNLDYVYSPKYGHLKLDKSKRHVGGEGILYGTYNNMLCKLYNEDHLSYINYKKLEKMLEIDIYNPFICWPKDIVYHKNDFVGYLMEEITNAKTLDELRITMFDGFRLIDRFFLCYHLLLNIDYLHKRNIIIGDLKLDNILVKSPTEVYLVDCGCYQLDDYACDVCHPEYTKKIYTNDELKRKLRSVEDEYYPINKIIFEILIGKNPNYNRDKGEVDLENRNQFHFPLDLSKIKEQTPEMQLWQVLSNRMREFFYYYFKEDKITYLSEWINELKIFIDTQIKQRERR